MKKATLMITFIVVIMVSLFMGASQKNYERGFNREISSEGIKSFSLSNVNGHVIVEPSRSGKIVVEARIYGRDKRDVDEVEILWEKKWTSLEVEADLPRNSNVTVDFSIKIPEALGAKVETVNGKITVTGNFKNLEAETVNGSLQVISDFLAGKFETVNGSLQLFAKGSVENNLEASTVNGSVTLTVGRADEIRVNASSLNGTIRLRHPDLKVTEESKGFFAFLDKKVYAQGKNPRKEVKLTTVNGSIRLLPMDEK